MNFCYHGLTMRNGSPTFHGVRRTSPRLISSTTPTHNHGESHLPGSGNHLSVNRRRARRHRTTDRQPDHHQPAHHLSTHHLPATAQLRSQRQDKSTTDCISRMTDEESNRYDLMHERSIDQYFLSLEDPEFHETNHRHPNHQPNDSLDIIPDCLRRVRD